MSPTRMILTALLMSVLAAPAAAAAPFVPEGYAGGNPFDCELQQAGLGIAIPRPKADPLCVEYDKSRQNLTQLGIVQFLSGEPARFAYVGDKCFYVQRDHWRGTVDQDSEQTETYNWDGWYFFDRARGAAGAFVENFTINNMSGDPSTFPGFPPPYKPFFSYGRAGMQAHSIPTDPRCVAKAARGGVYARPAGAPAPVPEQRPALAPTRARLRFDVAYRAGRDRAGRRCVRGAVRGRVTGRDARHVRRVSFRVRRRTVARDARRPFSRRIARRRLDAGGLTALLARVAMRDGRSVDLRRRVRRCG